MLSITQTVAEILLSKIVSHLLGHPVYLELCYSSRQINKAQMDGTDGQFGNFIVSSSSLANSPAVAIALEFAVGIVRLEGGILTALEQLL